MVYLFIIFLEHLPIQLCRDDVELKWRLTNGRVCSCERRFQSVVGQSLGGSVVDDCHPANRQQWRAIQTRERKLTLVGRFGSNAVDAWFPYIGTQRRQKTAACWSCSALLCLCVCQASSLHSRSQGGANDFTIVMSLDRTNEGGTVSFCSCARGRLFSFNGGLNTLMTIVQLHSLDLVGNIAVWRNSLSFIKHGLMVRSHIFQYGSCAGLQFERIFHHQWKQILKNVWPSRHLGSCAAGYILLLLCYLFLTDVDH